MPRNSFEWVFFFFLNELKFMISHFNNVITIKMHRSLALCWHCVLTFHKHVLDRDDNLTGTLLLPARIWHCQADVDRVWFVLCWKHQLFFCHFTKVEVFNEGLVCRSSDISELLFIMNTLGTLCPGVLFQSRSSHIWLFVKILHLSATDNPNPALYRQISKA